MQVWREWDDIFKEIKEKYYQSRILYPAKVSFRNEDEIKFFLNKQKLRDFITTRPVSNERLKGVLQTGTKGYQLVTLKHMKIYNILVKVGTTSDLEYSNTVI